MQMEIQIKSLHRHRVLGPPDFEKNGAQTDSWAWPPARSDSPWDAEQLI